MVDPVKHNTTVTIARVSYICMYTLVVIGKPAVIPALREARYLLACAYQLGALCRRHRLCTHSNMLLPFKDHVRVDMVAVGDDFFNHSNQLAVFWDSATRAHTTPLCKIPTWPGTRYTERQ